MQNKSPFDSQVISGLIDEMEELRAECARSANANVSEEQEDHLQELHRTIGEHMEYLDRFSFHSSKHNTVFFFPEEAELRCLQLQIEDWNDEYSAILAMRKRRR